MNRQRRSNGKTAMKQKKAENEGEEMSSRGPGRGKDAGEALDVAAAGAESAPGVSKDAAELPNSNESEGNAGTAVAIPTERQRTIARKSPSSGSQNVGREPWLGLLPPSEGPSSTANQNNGQLEDAEEF